MFYHGSLLNGFLKDESWNLVKLKKLRNYLRFIMLRDSFSIYTHRRLASQNRKCSTLWK
nr:hypothetical protein [Tanacetum cinerariifolium]